VAFFQIKERGSKKTYLVGSSKHITAFCHFIIVLISFLLFLFQQLASVK